MDYNITEIVRIVDGELFGNAAVSVNYILTDSRSLLYPSSTVFFARAGARHHGNNYVVDLYDRGVRCFVVESLPNEFLSLQDANFMLVTCVLTALQKFAAEHRNRFSATLIGITGSNGKTVVKEWIFQALRHERNIVRSPRSYNSQIGVPLSICLIDKHHDLAIIEAGISQTAEMERLQNIIKPQIGIFTNLGQAHSENFASNTEKAREKLKLFKNCQTLIYCRDYSEIKDIIENDIEFAALSTFSWSQFDDADIRVADMYKNEYVTTVKIIYGDQSFDLTIPFTDNASIENSLHVVSLMLFFGYDYQIINERILQLEPVEMRLDMKKGVNNCVIINDTYNSDIGSLSIALDLLSRRQDRATTVILSDILQSGKSQENLYRTVAQLLNEHKISRLIGIGNEISASADFFECEKHFFKNTELFLDAANRTLKFANEAILVKGSRLFEFERIVHLLEEKIHKTVLEINLNAVVHNYNYFKSLLRPDTKIVAMVKAFAYGTGSVEIASVLQHHRVDYLAVAFADEGKELRQNGITIPIMVMNPEESCFETLVRYYLEPEIYSFNILEICAKHTSNQGIAQYPIHIKLDTGMHRLGFVESDIDKLISKLQNLPSVRVKSVFSHLAAAENPNFDDFTRHQIDTFRNMCEKIRKGIGYPFTRHILNSAGIERFTDAQFDMVRLGIGLHGFSSKDTSNLMQTASLRTVIIQIKNILEGDSVGYSRNFIASKNIRIGIVPIGYADGLHRSLGNAQGSFLLNGKNAPIIGNISMDMCAIDLSGINASEGDTVIIFGDERPIAEFAHQMQTIPYEVLTSVAARVKRIYYQQ
jgi:alanine racemase